jgi:mono/diheme cytochrome c family protein
MGMSRGIVPYAVRPPMPSLPRRARPALLLAALALPLTAVAACGTEGIQLAKSNPNYQGAEIFHEHCAGCHSLDVAGTQGSATNVRTRENKDGPNFNQRREQVNDVLYAIRNGGFSSGPMPQDIVVGQQAEAVAKFVAANSGKEAGSATGTQQGGPTQGGSGGQNTAP